MLVVAGAGSGKTRVITTRIANLITTEDVHPGNIVALTFTNKAANEMKERVAGYLEAGAELPFVGTFHSYCLRLLRSNPAFGFEKFSILDGEDQLSLVKKIIKRFAVERHIKPSQALYAISSARNNPNRKPAGMPSQVKLIQEIGMAYEEDKTRSHSFDFDDLIQKVLEMLQSNESFREELNNNVKHLLVDEYQDTNSVQHELLKLIATNSKNKTTFDSLCAVGDEDQSIYSWRGAEVANMKQFKKDFKPVEVIKIEQNYRSVQPILHIANEVIQHNSQRNDKELWSERKAKNRVIRISCRSGYQEADIAAKIFQSLPKNTEFNQCAFLYRTHHQSRALEEALIEAAIPYRIVGGIRFYERKEIKDLLAYLRLIMNPFDRVSFFRVLNCPTRGLGAKFEALVGSLWQQEPLLDFHQILKKVREEYSDTLSVKHISGLREFLETFEELNSSMQPDKALNEIIHRIGYRGYLKDSYEEREARTKRENIDELVSSAAAFASDKKKENISLEGFLHDVALMQEKLKDESDNCVQLMTLHSAKGLEFDLVIIGGLEEGLLPSSMSLNERAEIEEERRLFYVGITRARERLAILSAQNRMTYGQMNDQSPSRFLHEVPRKSCIDINAAESYPSEVNSAIYEFLGRTPEKSGIMTFGAPPSAVKSRNKNDRPFTPSQPTTFQQHPRKEKAFRKTPITSKSAGTGQWRIHRPVLHEKFGTGVIRAIERNADSPGEFYITALFKIGEKKILSTFLKVI